MYIYNKRENKFSQIFIVEIKSVINIKYAFFGTINLLMKRMKFFFLFFYFGGS